MVAQDARGAGRKVLWFLGLWLAGIGVLAAAGYGIRWALGL